jgi:hypothetical protein
VRPARPARCAALAFEMGRTSSVGTPRDDSLATRASPASTTARTPSMVSEVSATLVDTITLRASLGASARSCSPRESEPCRGSTVRPSRAATGASAAVARRISAAPGKNTSTCPSGVSRTARATPWATRRSCGSSELRCKCSISIGNVRPSARTTVAPTKAATGPGSMVADITTRARSGRVVSRSRTSMPRHTSVSTCRSWNSSSTTADTPSSRGSLASLRTSTPSVRNQSRVEGPPARSKRMA